MCIQNLVKFCFIIFKLLSKTHILTSIKGRNSVANLSKMTLKNPKVGLVNDNLYTKFGKILSIHSQDMEQKTNSDVN